MCRAPAKLLHPDGSTTETEFPRLIAPQNPFKELAGLSHEVAPGVWADWRFEGDVFETEDQRNWTDASFKTFCTPLRLPFPVEVPAGDPRPAGGDADAPGHRAGDAPPRRPSPTFAVAANRPVRRCRRSDWASPVTADR